MTTANGTGKVRVPLSFVANLLATRRGVPWDAQVDRRRDLDQECGYPKTSAVTAQFLYDLYEREPYAARVVDVLPKETWKVQPSIYEDESADTVTPFEAAWDGLGKQTSGEPSWCEEEAGSPVLAEMLRADILSRIGGYGVLLFGFDDGKPLSEPVQPMPGRKLYYLHAFPEALAQVVALESSRKSRRFGLPTKYLLTFNDPSATQLPVTGASTGTEEVHWTRVVHIPADTVGTSPVFPPPPMLSVLNPLLDIRKVRGSSAEMFWLGAFQGISFETDPRLGGDVEYDADKLRDMIEAYRNGMQRDLQLNGFTAKTLAPTVSNPQAHIDVQVEAICVRLGIPKRKLLGSERGELASSQDEDDWNGKLRARQDCHVTPKIVKPVVNRLIAYGVLPQPKSFSVWWPDISAKSDEQVAGVALTRTQALAAYVAGGVDALIPPLQYLTGTIGMTDEEANNALKASAEQKPAETPTPSQETQTAPQATDGPLGPSGVPGASGAIPPG